MTILSAPWCAIRSLQGQYGNSQASISIDAEQGDEGPTELSGIVVLREGAETLVLHCRSMKEKTSQHNGNAHVDGESWMESHNQSRQIATAADQNVRQQEFMLAVEQHRRQIFRYLLASSRDVDTAETLTQECLLKAYRHWSGFRGDSSVATWLMRIAINLQRDHWRSRRLQFWRQTQRNAVDLDDACNWLPGNTSSPEDQALAREQVAQVWKAVERMTEKQRTVFLLRFVEDLQYNEIAQATDMHEGTVKAHASRALARVRQELGRDRRALRDSFAT